MTAQSKPSGKSTTKSMSDMFGVDMTQLSPALLTLPRFQAHAMHALLEQQREMLDFLARRCEADLALVDRVAKAKDVSDLAEAYRGFWQTAAHAYADEAKRSAEISAKSAASLRQELSELGPRPTAAA